ncbi:hypothetical protein M2386_002322 [Erwinia rhapontici]|nr:hypothetical protein [Erwinia rhapontici]
MKPIAEMNHIMKLTLSRPLRFGTNNFRSMPFG